MEKENTQLTFFFGIELVPDEYYFYFILDGNKTVVDHYKINSKKENNIINIEKTSLTKFYITQNVLNASICGSWDKFTINHSMKKCDISLDIFLQKEKEFIGLKKLKEKNAEQVKIFENYINKNEFEEIHENHYDWWAFPINEKSSFKYIYTLDQIEIDILKKDDSYLSVFLNGVKYLMFAWGWDIENQLFIEHPEKDQKWRNWPIRLYKATKSVYLLKTSQEKNAVFDKKINLYFESMQKFGNAITLKYRKMSYNGIDLSWIFKI